MEVKDADSSPSTHKVEEQAVERLGAAGANASLGATSGGGGDGAGVTYMQFLVLHHKDQLVNSRSGSQADIMSGGGGGGSRISQANSRSRRNRWGRWTGRYFTPK